MLILASVTDEAADRLLALLLASTAQREQRPAAWHALQLMKTTFLEHEGTANDRPEDSARHKHLAGSGKRVHTRGDVDGHPAHVLADQLALPRVNADADLEPQLLRRFGDRQSAAQGARRRTVESHKEAVSHGLYLATAKA